tara:strand:- start:1009 stop:1440 length:432 start_codon:yes stop_codon:yes gene_type:complete
MGKLKNIFSILSILQNVKQDHFSVLMDSLEKIRGEFPLVEKIRAVVDILVVIAEYTPSEVDDEIIQSIDQVVEGDDFEQLLNVVGGLFAHDDGTQKLEIDNETLAKITDDFQSKKKTKLPWSVIITLGFEIYKMIREWQKNDD